MIHFLEQIIYLIGKYGPLLLLLCSLFFLWSKENMFFYYSIGIFINSLLNIVLKGLIQQPRPYEDTKDFELALKNAKSIIFKNGYIPYDIFGMPSGHTQSCFFSSIFILLALKKPKIFLFYLFISFIVMYQRIKYDYHTLFQTIVGAIVGSSFAYYVFYLAQEKIKGKITAKRDDFAPI